MLYYKKTIEGEWIKYEERTWLAVLSWIWLLAVLSLVSDRVSEVVYRSVDDGLETTLFIVGLFAFAIMIFLSKTESIFIEWRQGVYSSSENNYVASKALGIFTAPHPKWFKIRRMS